MSPLDLPSRSLDGFPKWVLEPGQPLVRIHVTAKPPWHFSRRGSGRFDLNLLPSGGTCYLADVELAAYLEVFRDLPLVAESEIAIRSTSTFTLAEPLVLADCTVSEARRYGVTGALHSTDRYEVTQAWARAFSIQGFHGIRYRVSHDPEQTLIGVALFGDADHDGPANSRAISRSVIREAEERYGIRVRPAPTGPLSIQRTASSEMY